MSQVKAPFPYFGGKAVIAPVVWQYLGADVRNFVEPFFGSGACLLARPDWTPDAPCIETVNDLDGFIANFWRALQADPEAVTHYADYPVNENDLHARHAWLLGEREPMQAALEGDPDWYDAKIAGWWVWGIACWIGSGWCSGNGPWQRVQDEIGQWQLVHLGDAGRGVNRQLVHLGDAGQGVNRKLVHLGDAGQGVNRKRVHLGDAGRGNAGTGEQGLLAWMLALSERMKRVRVCSGDWSRVCGETPTVKQGLTAVFLDPPYSELATRTGDLYRLDSLEVAHAVREWAIVNGDNPMFRIALCGYDTEHAMPDGWTAHAWKTSGGYGSQGSGMGLANRHREVVWFSRHCLRPAQEWTLFNLPELHTNGANGAHGLEVGL